MKAWFQCFEGCSGKYPLNEVIYRCPDCNNLLEVAFDMDELKKKSGEEWKNLFDNRLRENQWPYGSSIWGKKEWVCPEIDDANIVSTLEGQTNLFWAERYGKEELGLHDLWVKQCGNSHTGSFKDLGMTVLVSMVNQMRAEGKDIPAVACASTGDTSAALAAYCAIAGIASIVFLPKNKVSNSQLIQPLAHGAITLSLNTDFDGCMEIVQQVCTKNNIYLANSMNSLRIEGQKTVSIEMVQQFNWSVPDYVIIPGGNLGNVSALGKGFKMMRDLGVIDKYPVIICAQAENANPLYLSYKTGFKEFKAVAAKKTLASAIQIGNPISYAKAVRTLNEFNGMVEQASESELANEVGIANKYGLLCCPHTGVALAALSKLNKKGLFKKNDKIVVVSTANGLKFTDFLLNYHEKTIEGVDSLQSNLPIEMEASYEKVSEYLNNHF
ncbi:MAG: threonine synthase [Nitrospinae bacterium]|nr:threonine synthase [Nitrospinota bacterium]